MDLVTTLHLKIYKCMQVFVAWPIAVFLSLLDVYLFCHKIAFKVSMFAVCS